MRTFRVVMVLLIVAIAAFTIYNIYTQPKTGILISAIESDLSKNLVSADSSQQQMVAVTWAAKDFGALAALQQSSENRLLAAVALLLLANVAVSLPALFRLEAKPSEAVPAGEKKRRWFSRKAQAPAADEEEKTAPEQADTEPEPELAVS
ncbi:MAG: hypothetical protein ACYC1U_02140 [Candidatus Aquicultorales bacterium]